MKEIKEKKKVIGREWNPKLSFGIYIISDK